MKRMIYLLIALMLIGSVNAQTNQTNQTATTTTQPGVVKDEHGCLTSAGFVYCALREKCIRPWEEACDDGRAVPLNGTSTTMTTQSTTTTTTLETPTSSTTSSTDTTLATPTTTIEAVPILISEPINVTNQNETVETTTTEAPTTTVSAPTTTIQPICGNMYQEVGEQCDTTASPCGAGRWQCIDCKCVPLPEETTTTSTTIVSSLNLTAVGSSINIPASIDTKYVIGAFIILIIVIVAILYFAGGKEDKEETKKH
jgi:hypothetical protein